MKSPSDIAERLARQWHRSSLRVERLLSADSWPLEMPIGKPSGAQFARETARVQEHVQLWREVKIGEVVWQTVNYRAGADAVPIPTQWRLSGPSEWIAATADDTVQKEFIILENIVANVTPIYRECLVTDRSLWRAKPPQEVIAAATLANALSPGIANGKPLRLLSGLDIDTKFFERHATLITRLLDERYDGAASEQGLNDFLDAPIENDHWLLVAPLDEGLLPFHRQRVTAQELTEIRLPGSHILVVENEQCIHLLPRAPDTIAILGAGLNLQWLAGDAFHNKKVAYWGDMDTWGLLMLGRARQYCPSLHPVMMTRDHFEKHAQRCAVAEPTPAQSHSPAGLNDNERAFFDFLLKQNKGRLEQEYLPEQEVQAEISSWLG